MQTQMTDLINQVKVMQAPPTAPPPAAGVAGAAPATPPISATELYNDADGDRRGGRLDMAVQGFSDFLKYYPDSTQAAAAQFYIGFIHYGQNDFETAADDFDKVVKNYADDNARAGGDVLRGQSLERIAGHKTAAADEYIDLIKKFPKTDYSTKACTQLKGLGRNCPSTTAAKKR